MSDSPRAEPSRQGKEKLCAERLLIATVGGSQGPLVYALRETRPGRVCFVCSRETVGSVDDIVARAAESLDGFDRARCDVVEVGGPDSETGIPGHEDMPRIVRKLHGELDKRVRDFLGQGPERKIYVDFTGGTKAMSAALVFWAESLAGRATVTYQYIGGVRASEGRGVVQTGQERPRVHTSPWEMGRQRVLHDYMRLFDAGAFEAAADLALQWRNKLEEPEKSELEALRKLADAFLRWELFDHKEAACQLKGVHKDRNDLSAALGSYATEELFESLKKLRDKAKDLAEQQDRRLLLLDVLANAERRLAEGRYDDATARAYRAIEAAAQIALKERHGIDTAAVSLSQLPERCQKKLEAKFADGEEAKLGLQDAHQLLACLDGRPPEGFREKRRDQLAARNNSILAHGWQHVKDKTAKDLVKTAKELAAQLDGGQPDKDLDLVKFPRLAGLRKSPGK